MKVVLSWSSGKDSAWTVHLLRQRPNIQVTALLTTFNSEANRVAMHAVRRALVEAQAERTGIPLWAVELPWPSSNLEYEERIRAACQRATAEGITAVAFGDLFLQDVRDYRVRQLQGSGLEPLFPVWKIPTQQLSRDMIAAGVKAKITCVDPSAAASVRMCLTLDCLTRQVQRERTPVYHFVYHRNREVPLANAINPFESKAKPADLAGLSG
jgi:diphthamide synthase (EF-2-diphthine--ammonia ligase)